MPKLPLPVAQAVLLADNIISEAGTHKKSLIGIFCRMLAPRLPMRKVLNVYAQLTDALGEYDFDIELVNLGTLDVINTGKIDSVVAADRLAPLEIVMHLPSVFSTYGEYEFRIYYEGNMFAHRRFSVIPAEIDIPENN